MNDLRSNFLFEKEGLFIIEIFFWNVEAYLISSVSIAYNLNVDYYLR